MNDKKKQIGFSFAWNGLREILKTERNFKIHLFIALTVIIIGLFLNLVCIEWAIIILVIALVLISEIVNSAIEKMIDYFKPEIHPEAKIIKDISAGAVLLSTITSIIIGLIIFIPKLFEHFF